MAACFGSFTEGGYIVANYVGHHGTDVVALNAATANSQWL